MDAQQQLFGLMAVAEENQKAMKAALEGLAAERAAIAKERTALAEMGLNVTGVAKQVERMAGQAMLRSLSDASTVAVSALGLAAKPFIDSLSATAKAADAVEVKLSRTAARLNWKMGLVVVGAVASGIVAIVIAAWVTVGWQRDQLEDLQQQRQAMIDDIAKGQIIAEDWAKKGGRAKLTMCGTPGRLCVRVDAAAGAFGSADDPYYVLKGY